LEKKKEESTEKRGKPNLGGGGTDCSFTKKVVVSAAGESFLSVKDDPAWKEEKNKRTQLSRGTAIIFAALFKNKKNFGRSLNTLGGTYRRVGGENLSNGGVTGS